MKSNKQNKTMVTVPTLRAIGADDKKNATTSSPTTMTPTSGSSSQSLIKQKQQPHETSTDIQRKTATSENESSRESIDVKKAANGNRIVLTSRSMLRPSAMTRPSIVQRVVLQGSSSIKNTVDSTSNQSPQKLYTMLKNTNVNSSGAASQTKTPEMKSLIICGQAQALMAQQKKKQQQQQQQQQILQIQQYKKQQKHLLTTTVAQSTLPKKAATTAASTSASSTPTSASSELPQLSTNSKFVAIKIKEEPLEVSDMKYLEAPDMKPMLLGESDGVVRRKHCNCSKSQCLKLYCDCFANGEFCQDCTCKDCFNNLQYEDERQRAIRNCLERNPSAFKPKITTARDQGDMRLHNKGCNCKRSGCLKNYCECYEAKIPCSSNCKCIGCRNIEDRPDLDMDPIDSKLMANIANATTNPSLAGQKRTYDKTNINKMMVNDKFLKDATKALSSVGGDLMSGACSSSGSNSGQPPEKQQCNFITQEVIDATIQCMISQADECDKNGLPAYQTEKMVMEELGRCLVEIIDFSIRNTDSSFTQD